MTHHSWHSGFASYDSPAFYELPLPAVLVVDDEKTCVCLDDVRRMRATRRAVESAEEGLRLLCTGKFFHDHHRCAAGGMMVTSFWEKPVHNGRTCQFS